MHCSPPLLVDVKAYKYYPLNQVKAKPVNSNSTTTTTNNNKKKVRLSLHKHTSIHLSDFSYLSHSSKPSTTYPSPHIGVHLEIGAVADVVVDVDAVVADMMLHSQCSSTLQSRLQPSPVDV